MTTPAPTLDLSPAADAAPRLRRIASHARLEATLVLRNGEQLLLALVIPVGLLAAGMLLGPRIGLAPQPFGASVLALALWSTSFTSLAINTGFERRHGVLERLVGTPLSRADVVAGKALASTAIALGQLLLLAAVALALGWRPAPQPAQTLVVLVAAPLAVVTFAGWALLMAGRLRAEATLALANLVYLVVAAGFALILPVGSYPEPLRPVLALLPPGLLGETLRTWATGGLNAWPLLPLAGWLVVSLFLARKAFRWTS